MTRRNDLFARLSLDYADHPKIAGLSDGAFRAHIEMILYSRRYMTDGQIAKQIAKRWPEQALSELLANDSESPSLLVNDDGSYQLHGFEEMQETRSEIEHKRRVRAEAGRKGGQRKAKQSAKHPASKLPSKNVAETETEAETDSNSAPKPPKQRKKPETAIPDDWQPTDAHKTKAHEKGVDLHQQAEAFRLHAETHDRRCVNWNSAFSMWLTKARPDTGPKQYQNAAEKKVEVARHWLSQPASQAPADPWALPANTQKEIEE